MSELLKREKMARVLFEVGAPPHQFWDDVALDKRELYLCMADAALSQGSSDHAPTPHGCGDQIEALAIWLHNETDHPEHCPGYTWPENEHDDGRREGGFVKIVPKFAQEYFRDIARRMFAGPLAPPVRCAARNNEPYTVREALAAMLLTHDAGGVTLSAAADARAALATTSPEPSTCKDSLQVQSSPEPDAVREALVQAQKAISTLAVDALGYGEDDAGRWPLRDELLQAIDTALSAPVAGAPHGEAIAKLDWLIEYYERNRWTHPLEDLRMMRRILDMAQPRNHRGSPAK